ncbi:hypothetical protein D3C86_1944100 [compost metagenome]
MLALAGLQLRPAAVVESLLGGGHGHIDILHVASGDLGQWLAGGRVGGDKGTARQRITEFTVDERLGTEFHFGGDCRVLLFTQQLSHCWNPR